MAPEPETLDCQPAPAAGRAAGRAEAPEPIGPTEPRAPPERSGLRRGLLVALGLLLVGLGALGAFLPLLPTTPFLLLASACFIRSSPRLNRWLLRSRLFGPFLRDWQKHRGVRLHVKVIAIAMLAAAVTLSLLSETLSLPLQIMLVSLALIGLVVVLRLKLIR